MVCMDIGQNINLPVCVCLSVCVYVTLSVNSPTGQTPQRIFTADSLTDADLRKDVLFGVLRYEKSHWESKVPQNPHFGGLNRHFKPNMRKIQTGIFRSVYHIDMKFDRQLRLATETSWVVSYHGKQFQDGGRPPFWKSIYRHLHQWKIIGFSWNFVHSSRFWTSHDQKLLELESWI